MKHFEYQAVIASGGQRMQGVVEAKNENSAVEVLRGKGLIVTHIKDQDYNFKFRFLSRFARVGFNELVLFTRQLATMINSGLPILSSLTLINKKTSIAMRKVVDEIITQIEGGTSLYNAMINFPDVFSDVYLALVKSGEVAGILDAVLDRLSDTMEKQREFRQKVQGAMIYPSVVIAAMFVAGGIMMFFIIPKVSDLFSQFDIELPAMTKFVLAASAFMTSKWYLFLAMLIGLGIALYYFLRTKEGKQKFDEYILKVPFIGELQHKVISATVMNTLSLLVKSGVSIVESLEIVSESADNYMYKKGIENAADAVEKGTSISAAFGREAVFPEVVIQMMAVGEETGKLDEMLMKISDQFQKDSEAALKALTQAIEPMLMIVLGVAVGFLVMTVIMPIYTLTSSF